MLLQVDDAIAVNMTWLQVDDTDDAAVIDAY